MSPFTLRKGIDDIAFFAMDERYSIKIIGIHNKRIRANISYPESIVMMLRDNLLVFDSNHKLMFNPACFAVSTCEFLTKKQNTLCFTCYGYFRVDTTLGFVDCGELQRFKQPVASFTSREDVETISSAIQKHQFFELSADESTSEEILTSQVGKVLDTTKYILSCDATNQSWKLDTVKDTPRLGVLSDSFWADTATQVENSKSVLRPSYRLGSTGNGVQPDIQESLFASERGNTLTSTTATFGGCDMNTSAATEDIY